MWPVQAWGKHLGGATGNAFMFEAAHRQGAPGTYLGETIGGAADDLLAVLSR